MSPEDRRPTVDRFLWGLLRLMMGCLRAGRRVRDRRRSRSRFRQALGQLGGDQPESVSQVASGQASRYTDHTITRMREARAPSPGLSVSSFGLIRRRLSPFRGLRRNLRLP